MAFGIREALGQNSFAGFSASAVQWIHMVELALCTDYDGTLSRPLTPAELEARSMILETSRPEHEADEILKISLWTLLSVAELTLFSAWLLYAAGTPKKYAERRHARTRKSTKYYGQHALPIAWNGL